MEASATAAPDRYSTYALLRRLVVDVALDYWPRYVVAFLLMGFAAAATALAAYLLGTLTNAAVVSHNFQGIVVVGLVSATLFALRGLAVYFSAVMIAAIGNHIVANNQRLMLDRLLRQGVGYFADRHSSEFIARLTTGAYAVSTVINLLIFAIGRDLLSLIGLSIVMVI